MMDSHQKHRAYSLFIRQHEVRRQCVRCIPYLQCFSTAGPRPGTGP